VKELHLNLSISAYFHQVASLRRCETEQYCDSLSCCILRKCKFLKKFIVSDNMLCQVFKDVAMDELALLASRPNAY